MSSGSRKSGRLAAAHNETKSRAANARLELAQGLLGLLAEPPHRLCVGRLPLLAQVLRVDVLPDRLVAHRISHHLRSPGHKLLTLVQSRQDWGLAAVSLGENAFV